MFTIVALLNFEWMTQPAETLAAQDMVLNRSPSARWWRLWPRALAPCKAWPSATAFGGKGLTRASAPAPFHHAFDGEEGLDHAFPPTQISKEALLSSRRRPGPIVPLALPRSI